MDDKKRNCQIMVFPNGPVCNLNCKYCYYLKKKALYPAEENFCMTESVLERFIKTYIEMQEGPEVFFIWQGGEPTLRGLPFFQRAVELQKKYLPEGWHVYNSIQTNGTLLDKAWYDFFKKENFLIGLSIDGPAAYHDAYRKDRAGRGTHKKVEEAMMALKKYGISYNIICTVNHANAAYPDEVYDYFVNRGVTYLQFIPIVNVEEDGVSPESVSSAAYAHFMIQIFDRWWQSGVGRIFIQSFEECLSVWMRGRSSVCVYAETCGNAPVMEHNGDLYACDHFVTEEYKLGNLMEHPLPEIVFSEKQMEFGRRKKQIGESCKTCKFLHLCYGGCLRSRSRFPSGEYKDYLCEGNQAFYEHIAPYMEKMCDVLRR